VLPTAPISQQLVGAIFARILGRDADAAGLAFWSGQLDQGMTPRQIILAFVHSGEFFAHEVDSLYQRILNRSADASALSEGATFLASGGTVEQLEATLLSSPEYLQLHGGIPAAAVAAGYLAVLGRPIDPSALNAVNQALAQGVSTTTIMTNLVASTEARQAFLNRTYEQFLNRPVDAAGLRAWLPELALPFGEKPVQDSIAGSAELLSQLTSLVNGTRFPGGLV
jgi:hypothetical protein